jgi:hypothetical protein
MGKPEIIGYEPDPDRYWSSPSQPEMTFDSDGISIPWQYIGSDGRPFEAPRYLTNTEVDQLMRECGMKRVYKERRMKAYAAHGGYRLYCKNCMTTTLTNAEKLPHDTAIAHRCLYTPDDKE